MMDAKAITADVLVLANAQSLNLSIQPARVIPFGFLRHGVLKSGVHKIPDRAKNIAEVLHQLIMP